MSLAVIFVPLTLVAMKVNSFLDRHMSYLEKQHEMMESLIIKLSNDTQMNLTASWVNSNQHGEKITQLLPPT